jgi:hypothetical protein
MKFIPNKIKELKENQVFVFGSNKAGIHGKGAALTARQRFGAIMGAGKGLQGRSYAIPTKDFNIKKIGLDEIRKYVTEFLSFAKEHKETEFLVTEIGCGLAGNEPDDIALMFKDHSDNIIVSERFHRILYKGNQLF